LIPDDDITVLLRQWTGEGDSADALFNAVYPRLRQIAGSLFRGESPAHVLQPTGVVNELFIKLVRQRELRFENREHFYSLAARLMRRILVDHARAGGRRKRDRALEVPLHPEVGIDGDAANAFAHIADAPAAELLDLDSALHALNALDPRMASIVELRYFLGTTAEEAAEVLNISKATVDRELNFARGWLRDRMQGTGAALP
jgi:RNA polymerase sigma factor (TIGR02999 family)